MDLYDGVPDGDLQLRRTPPHRGRSTLPSLSLPATVGTSASGGITDTATLSSADASPSSVSASASGSVFSVPQFGLTLTDNQGGDLSAGGTVKYTATPSLLASGGTESIAPTYSQTLATGVTPTGASGTNWTCSKSGQTVNCTYSGALPIAPGTTLAPITVTANVSAGASGNVSSTGTAQSSTGVGHGGGFRQRRSPGTTDVERDRHCSLADVRGEDYTLMISPTVVRRGSRRRRSRDRVDPSGR